MTHDTSHPKERGLLPLSAQREETTSRGLTRTWTIRLPVRAEQVRIGKQVVVAEEVTLRVDTTERTVEVKRPVRRERLQVDVDGDVAVDQRGEPR